MHLCDRVGGLDGLQAESGRHIGIGALDQQALGRVLHPAFRTGQFPDQLRGIQFCQRLPSWRCVTVENPINPPQSQRMFQTAGLDLAAQIRRDRYSMLQNATIKVRDVKRAIRSVVEAGRTETFVGRSQKILVLISFVTGHPAILFNQNVAHDEIARRLADEGVAAVFGREIVPAINQRPARCRRLRQSAVGTQNVLPIPAVDTGCHVNGPDGLVVNRIDTDAALEAIVGISAGTRSMRNWSSLEL